MTSKCHKNLLEVLIHDFQGLCEFLEIMVHVWGSNQDYGDK